MAKTLISWWNNCPQDLPIWSQNLKEHQLSSTGIYRWSYKEAPVPCVPWRCVHRVGTAVHQPCQTLNTGPLRASQPDPDATAQHRTELYEKTRKQVKSNEEDCLSPPSFSERLHKYTSTHFCIFCIAFCTWLKVNAIYISARLYMQQVNQFVFFTFSHPTHLL